MLQKSKRRDRALQSEEKKKPINYSCQYCEEKGSLSLSTSKNRIPSQSLSLSVSSATFARSDKTGAAAAVRKKGHFSNSLPP